MTGLLYLIPVALFMGGIGLVAFIWSLKSGQYDDLEGAAWRILQDDDQPQTEQRADVDAFDITADENQKAQRQNGDDSALAHGFRICFKGAIHRLQGATRRMPLL